MAITVIGFNRLSVPAQIERTRLIVTNMTGNASFSAPNPALVTITTAVDALEVAYNESRGRDKVKMALMRIRQKELLNLISSLAGYVQSTSEGDEAIILSSGFSVRKTPQPVGPVTAPKDLEVEQGTVTNSLLARWKSVTGGVAYVVEISSDASPEDKTFNPIGVTTKGRFQVDNLNSGEKYWIRVAAIGKEGVGPFSDPYRQRVI